MRAAPPRTEHLGERLDAWAPARVVDVELLDGVPHLPGAGTDGARHARVMCIARLGGVPVGVRWLEVGPDGLSARALAELLWREIGETVTTRTRAGGLEPPLTLAPDGLHDRRGAARARLAAAAEPAPPAAVVVATRDRPERLAACLDSLLLQSHPADLIVVVDNASRDDAARRVVARHRPDRVRYVREDRPGLAHAHNRGLCEVAAPVVAFADDDVLADVNWLHRIASPFGRDADVGCVTGMILPLRLETPAQVWFERSVGLGKGFASVRAHTGGPRVDALLPVATGRLGSGANMAFATSLLRDMGGFDPLLGAGTSCRGGDDLAAFFDVLVRGHAVVYEPGAVIWHDHHDDLKALRRAMDGYGVGLGAHLARCAIERPAASFGAVGRALLEMRRAAPTGARRRLSAAERRGVAIGAGRYLRARMGRGR